MGKLGIRGTDLLAKTFKIDYLVKIVNGFSNWLFSQTVLSQTLTL